MVAASSNNSKNGAPIFFIDEVPSEESKDDDSMLNYLECVFLRNIIRVMKCICILSGTEAALMNAIDKIPKGSRTDIGDRIF